MPSADLELQNAILKVPKGTWVIGVSGGADSVALLVAMRHFYPEARIVVAHLDHQARGSESDADREFVAELATSLGITARIARISEFDAIRHPNLEARFRLARFALFREVVAEHTAEGVLLAHHADDRAETTLLRLLRGGEYTSLDALKPTAKIDDIVIRRPLLAIRRGKIESFLRDCGQAWREDQSNASEAFARNRVRKILNDRPETVARLLQLSDAAGAVRKWVDSYAPSLKGEVRIEQVADLPDLLSRRALRNWLRSEQVMTENVSPALIDQVMLLARDAAVGRAVNLPGGFHVRRNRSRLRVMRAVT